MSDLTLNLDDTTFERLVELARALIPRYAPTWTDHNVHDPGMTLLELMAWNAEAQIYSLGRPRRDERAAYAALLGVQPRGPQPAMGTIWPALPRANTTGALSWARGTFLTRATTARSDREDAPQFTLARELLLVDATLARVSVIDAEGQIRDVTMSNRQEGAGFRPFGPAGSCTLRLTLKGSLATPLTSDAPARVISLGVEVPNTPALALPKPDEPAGRVPFTATLIHDGRRHALPVALDTTRGLLRGGVLLLDVGRIDVAIASDFAIELAPLPARLLRVPEIARIEPNVLPVIDQHALTSVALTASSSGLLDQAYRLPQPGLMFGSGAADPTVRIDNGYSVETWRRVDSLAECRPDDAAFVLERGAARVCFGNGVNGKVPPRGAIISVDYEVCSGARGTLPRRLRWRIKGIAGVFGENPAAMSGGADAATLDDLQRQARSKLRRERPLVTSADLEDAARALDDLGVARAHEMARTRHDEPGTRSLVVLATRRAGDDSTGYENEVWRAAIRARLQKRLPLGQRLRVIAPQYVTVGIKASLLAKRQSNREDIKRQAREELLEHFALVPGLAGKPLWPFEREVTLLETMGWLRRVPAVARVVDATLSLDGRAVERMVTIRGAALPRLVLNADDITVLAHGAASS